MGTKQGTNRTGTTRHIQWRQQLIHRARRNGQTQCPICGTQIAWNTHGQPNSPEADHITPNTNGGKETLTNGRIICLHCNRSLGGKLGAQKRKQKQQAKKPALKNKHIKVSRKW